MIPTAEPMSVLTSRVPFYVNMGNKPVRRRDREPDAVQPKSNTNTWLLRKSERILYEKRRAKKHQRKLTRYEDRIAKLKRGIKDAEKSILEHERKAGRARERIRLSESVIVETRVQIARSDAASSFRCRGFGWTAAEPVKDAVPWTIVDLLRHQALERRIFGYYCDIVWVRSLTLSLPRELQEIVFEFLRPDNFLLSNLTPNINLLRICSEMATLRYAN